MGKKKKIGFAVLGFFLVGILLGIAYFYHSYESIKEEDEKIASFPKIENSNLDNVESYNEIDGITNILLMGIDDRGTGEPVRSDTIMILTLDDNNKKIKLTSIMRDTYVKIPGHGEQKITHAFAYGGVNLLAQTIETNFKIRLEQYVKINFNGFKDLANSLGGLDVKLNNYEEVNELNRCILLEIYEDPKSDLKKVKEITDSAGLLALREEGAPLIKNNPRLTTEDFNYISEKAGFIGEAGTVHLNGTQLLAYSRMRHVGGGSYERTERQRNVVNLLIGKLKDTPQTKYFSIANKLLPYIKTNIPITDALNLAYTTYKIDNLNFEQLQIPATKLSDGRIYKNKGWVLLIDREKNLKVITDFIFNNIKYNETKYDTFNYKKSEYYYEAPVIHEIVNTEEDNESNENQESKVPKEDKDSKNENTTTTNNPKEIQEQDKSNKESNEIIKDDEKINVEENIEEEENLEEEKDLDTEEFKNANE